MADGWHLPSDSEWSRLIALIGSEYTAGEAMKSTKGWGENGNVTNSSGFNGMPAGYRDSDVAFGGIGKGGYFWSSTEESEHFAAGRTLNYIDSEVIHGNITKASGCSVRCLQDLF